MVGAGLRGSVGSAECKEVGTTLSIIDGRDEVCALGRLEGVGLWNIVGSIDRKMVGVELTVTDG